jgi:hypothetical protein
MTKNDDTCETIDNLLTVGGGAAPSAGWTGAGQPARGLNPKAGSVTTNGWTVDDPWQAPNGKGLAISPNAGHHDWAGQFLASGPRGKTSFYPEYRMDSDHDDWGG